MYLLMNYWQTGKALNNADERLALVARMTQDEWLIEKPILAEFFTVRGNKWTHARMEYDLERVLSKSKKASFAGSQSARKRANKRLTNVKQVFNHTDTDTDTEADNKKKKISVIKDDHSKAFSTFWLMYPRKVGKLAAQKSFEKALKSVTPQEIFEGVIRYQRTCGDDPKFVAHPATWLAQGRWMDSQPQVEVKGSQIQSSNHLEVHAPGQYGVKICQKCETSWPCAEMQKRGVK
jgi:uncharacterized protein YdaU (DUF1376 family)